MPIFSNTQWCLRSFECQCPIMEECDVIIARTSKQDKKTFCTSSSLESLNSNIIVSILTLESFNASNSHWNLFLPFSRTWCFLGESCHISLLVEFWKGFFKVVCFPHKIHNYFLGENGSNLKFKLGWKGV